MISLAQLAVFVPAAVLVALSPGANNLLAMQHGLRFGAGEAVLALAGRLAAFLVMLALAAAGLAAVLVRSQTVFEVIRWAGVAYLAHLGVRSIRPRARRRTPQRSALAPSPAASCARAASFSRSRPIRRRCCSSPRSCRSSSIASEPVAGQLLVLGLIYIGSRARGRFGLGTRRRAPEARGPRRPRPAPCRPSRRRRLPRHGRAARHHTALTSGHQLRRSTPPGVGV